MGRPMARCAGSTLAKLVGAASSVTPSSTSSPSQNVAAFSAAIPATSPADSPQPV